MQRKQPKDKKAVTEALKRATPAYQYTAAHQNHCTPLMRIRGGYCGAVHMHHRILQKTHPEKGPSSNGVNLSVKLDLLRPNY